MSLPSNLSPAERLARASTIEDLEIYTDTSSEYSESDAQAEWEESLHQIQDVLLLVIVPYLGKYLGRRFAYYIWAKASNYKYGRVPVISNEATFAATSVIEATVTL